MSHKVETLAWTNEKPWHGLGVEVEEGLTVAKMLKVAGLNWTVSKRDVFLQGGAQVPGTFALVRDGDESILTTCGASYKPVQNEQAFSFFKKFVDAGKMTLEVAGSLDGGRYVFGLARVGSTFKVGKGKSGDNIRNYLLLSSPHVSGKAMTIQYTAVRVVCWNTLTFALGHDLRGDGSAFRMPHVYDFNADIKAAAELALGLVDQHANEFKRTAEALSSVPVKSEDALREFAEVTIRPWAYRGDENRSAFRQLLDEVQAKPEPAKRDSPIVEDVITAYTMAPGQDTKAATGTWWGAVNAVTYVIDHHVAQKNPAKGMLNAWSGARAKTKRLAVTNAIKFAGLKEKELVGFSKN